MDHDVGSLDGARERTRISKVSVHGSDVRSRSELMRQRLPVIHQAEGVSAGDQMTGEQTAQVASGAGDQNGGELVHVSSMTESAVFRTKRLTGAA